MPEDFTFTEGESELTAYGKEGGMGKYHFCKHCGVHVLFSGAIGDTPITMAFVTTFDDIPKEELAKISVRYADGLNNQWGKTPQITSIL